MTRPPKHVLPDDDPRLIPTIERPGRAEQIRGKARELADTGAQPVEGRQPVLYLMGGGSGSGKSTVGDALRERGAIPSDNIVEIDPDGIKMSTDEFKELKALREPRGADVVHEESKAVAHQARDLAMEDRKDIYYDVTLGAKDPSASLQMIDNAHASGYDVRLYGVTVPTDEALKRRDERWDKTGRYVADDIVKDGHKNFSANFPQYADRCDQAALFDNSGSRPVLVAAKERGGELEVTDPERYAEFQKKAEADPAATGPKEPSRVPGQRDREPEARPSEQPSRSGPPRPPAEDMERVTPEQSSGGGRDDGGGGGMSGPSADKGGAEPS